MASRRGEVSAIHRADGNPQRSGALRCGARRWAASCALVNPREGVVRANRKRDPGRRMTPELLAELGIAAGGATASGLRVYGTAAALGWFHRAGVLQLPDGLDVLASPWVVGIATALYVVEFVADKIPAFDSVWDGVHTFVRIPAASLLAFAALGDAPETWRVVAGLLSGGVALSVHGVKAGTRLAVNTSPEPFSNWGLSLGEDLSFVGLLYLLVAHPLIAVACAALALAVGCLAIAWIARSLRRLGRRREPA